MLKGVTQDEMNRLSELSNRYAESGNDKTSLTEEEWEFVLDIGLRLVANN